MVNKINLLRKSLLRYQYFNNGIKSKKAAFFDFGVTTWKTMNKWQKEGCFTTSVPVDPKFLDDDLSAGFRGMYFTSNDGSASEIFAEYKIGDNWQIAPGYMFFNGPKDSRLGQFSHDDMVYFRLRYSF